MYYYPDELYHHGIKGQRWGVRNGPPYPLSPQTHASVVRSGSGRGRTRPVSKGRVRGLTEEDTKYDPKFRSKAERDEYERRSARAQKIKKGLMIGAGATAAAAGLGYLAYRNRDALARYARTAGAKGRQGLTQARLGAKKIRYAAKDISGRALFKGKRAATNAANTIVTSGKASAETAQRMARNAAESAQTSARIASAKARHNAVEARLAAKRARYAAKDISNRAAFETNKAVSGVAKNVSSAATNTGRGIRDMFNKGRSAATLTGRTAVARGRQGLTQARLGAKKIRYAAKDIGGRAAFKTKRFYRDNPWIIPTAAGVALGGGTAAGISAYRRRKSRKRRR